MPDCVECGDYCTGTQYRRFEGGAYCTDCLVKVREDNGRRVYRPPDHPEVTDG